MLVYGLIFVVRSILLSLVGFDPSYLQELMLCLNYILEGNGSTNRVVSRVLRQGFLLLSFGLLLLGATGLSLSCSWGQQHPNCSLTGSGAAWR